MAVDSETYSQTVSEYQHQIRELKAQVQRLTETIEEMQGKGYATASEVLKEWFNGANIQGVAEMHSEDLLEMLDGFQNPPSPQPGEGCMSDQINCNRA